MFFLVKEGWFYVVFVCSFMCREDILDDIFYVELIKENSFEILVNGGSCIVVLNGEWLVELIVNREKLIMIILDYVCVCEEC